METFDVEIVLRCPLKAYTREDAGDQVKKFLREMPSFMEALEDCGVRFDRFGVVSVGTVGGTEGSARKEIITRKELLQLLTGQHELHKMPSWRYHYLSEIEIDTHTVPLRAALADLEHQQWSYWSKDLAETLVEIMGLLKPPAIVKVGLALGLGRRTLKKNREKMAEEILARLKRWKALWVTPYLNLKEDQQKQDLVWADKAMEAIKAHLEEGWPR
jgi:hypothetical protein